MQLCTKLQSPCRSAGSFRFLIAQIDPAILTQSGKSNHSACSQARHPGEIPLLFDWSRFIVRTLGSQQDGEVCGMQTSVDNLGSGSSFTSKSNALSLADSTMAEGYCFGDNKRRELSSKQPWLGNLKVIINVIRADLRFFSVAIELWSFFKMIMPHVQLFWGITVPMISRCKTLFFLKFRHHVSLFFFSISSPLSPCSSLPRPPFFFSPELREAIEWLP